MLDQLDLWLSSLDALELFFFYFWALVFPSMGACWLIETACLRLFKGNRSDWRNVK